MSFAVSLDTSEYATDPHAVYQQARQFGPFAPVQLAPGVAGTVVTDHAEALEVLHDREHKFTTDPRTWQQQVSPQCPLRAAMQWRPTPQRNSGTEHQRYRGAVSAALAGVSQHNLQSTVAQAAVALINAFCGRGHADLRADFAVPVTFAALHQLVGVPRDAGNHICRALADSAAATDAATATRGYDLLTTALAEVLTQKQAAPADDVATSLLRQPGLNDDEVVAQLAGLYTAGAEPTTSLILNTFRMLLTDPRVTADVLGGGITAAEAVEDALFVDPPVDGCVRYPRSPQLMHTHWIDAHQPVVVSIAACNRDPALHSAERSGNRAHLAWGAGSHTCPASDLAALIATTALEQLLDALPVMQLAIPADQLSWFATPFFRALTMLPVTFTPAPPLHHL